jgi:hypothetical protein
MKRLFVMGMVAGAFAACTPDITQTPTSQYVTALFTPDPDPSKSVVPTPTILVLDPSTRLLAVPLAPGASPAQADFVAFLNTLDGFPEDTPGKTTFDKPLAPASVNANSVQVFDLKAGAPVAGATAVYVPTPDNPLSQGQISIVPPPSGWPGDTLLGVALIGGSSGLQGAQGEQVVGSAAWGLVRSSTPLVTCTALTLSDGGINPECQPTVTVIPSNEQDPAARQQDQARTAVQLERLRILYQPFLDLLQARGIGRENVALAWTFPVTTRPQVPFDPARNTIPFPNDIVRPPLADGGTPHVALPLPPPLPDGGVTDIGQLYMGLNTLDGFSTTAPIVSVFNADTAGAINQGAIDAGSLVQGAGWGFTRLGGNPAHPATTPSVRACLDCASSPLPDGGTPNNPQRLQFVPLVPLDERTQYGAYITTNVTDTRGRKVIPSSAFVLLRSATPLFDGTKSTVDLITDAQAQQLEPLRAALKPFIDSLATNLGGRSNIALAWAFTTQSEVTTLKLLQQLPGGLPPATANPLFLEDATAAIRPVCPGGCPNIGTYVIGEVNVAFLLTGPGGVFNPAQPPVPSIRKIPFLLTLPLAPPPLNGYPVTIFGHGLTGARTNVLAIADRLAQSGQASIATDVVWHGDRAVCTGSSAVGPPGSTDDVACASSTAQMCDAASGRCILRDRTNPTLRSCAFGMPLADQVCINFGQGFCFSDSKCEGGDYARDATTHVPLISGWNILNLTNLFATRDNFRQQVIDLSQLTRVLESGGPGNFNDQLSAAVMGGPRIDATKISYAGQSLGGILGTLYTSVASEVHNVVLNAPGGDPANILLLSPSFSTQRTAFLRTLAGQGIAPGSIGFDTFIGIAKWILDPADPQNMAFSVMNGSRIAADRKALVQYITLDEVFPNVTTAELINAGNRQGSAMLDTFLFNPSTSVYPPSCNPQGVCDPTIPSRHGFLLRSPDLTTIQTAQCQVANYVTTGSIGTCP